jgi:hypothetical protein
MDRLFRALPAASLTSLVLKDNFGDGDPINSVSQLTALQRLSTASSIEWLATLTQLTRLDLLGASGPLDPASQICALSRLQHLVLRGVTYPGNPLDWQSLSGLTFIGVFGLADEPDSHMPDFASLPNLRHLMLVHCGVVQLHPVLSRSPTLTALALTDNPGLGSSGELQVPPKLAHLMLDNCDLSAIPASVASSGALTYLDLSVNEGITFPGSLCLTSLQHLILGDCGLKQLPPVVSFLSALTCLDVSGNREMSLDIPLLAPLRCLRVLELRCIDLAALPEGMSCLSSLTRLDVSNGSASPESVGLMGLCHLSGMPCLQVLDLESRRIGELPHGLHALFELHLSFSDFSQAQGSLVGLPSLQCLHMGNCIAEHGLPEGTRDLPNLSELVVPGGGQWPQQDAQWLQDVFGSDGSEFDYADWVELHRIV